MRDSEVWAFFGHGLSLPALTNDAMMWENAANLDEQGREEKLWQIETSFRY